MNYGTHSLIEDMLREELGRHVKSVDAPWSWFVEQHDAPNGIALG